jgi:hypothetical protein
LELAGLAFEAEVYRLRPEGLSLRPLSEEYRREIRAMAGKSFV